MGRVLAVDPGEKRIGLALSDPSGTIANPYRVILHIAREIDAAKIAEIAAENEVQTVVIGQALDSEGQIGPQARKSQRLADAFSEKSKVPVVLWDESDSTQIARKARVAMKTSRSKRKGHMDDLAATVILQSYLDSRSPI